MTPDQSIAGAGTKPTLTKPPVIRVPLHPVSSYKPTAPSFKRENPSAVERKLAGLHDATDMMRVLDTEVALRRAKRLHGSGSRQALRVAAITSFFVLLIAALAAMFYLQSKLSERGLSRHRAEVTATPTPGPAAPAAARTAQSAGRAR